MAGLADGCPVFINCNFIRNGFWHAAVHIQVNKRPDAPCFAKVIGRIVVICRIKAQVLDGNVRIKVTKFLKRDNPADAVVAPCVQETDMQRKVDSKLAVMVRQHVQRISCTGQQKLDT